MPWRALTLGLQNAPRARKRRRASRLPRAATTQFVTTRAQENETDEPGEVFLINYGQAFVHNDTVNRALLNPQKFSLASPVSYFCNRCNVK